MTSHLIEMTMITQSDAPVGDGGSFALDGRGDGSQSAPPVDADGDLPADTGGREGSRSDTAVSADGPYEGTVAGDPVDDEDSYALDHGGGECSPSVADAIADGSSCECLFFGFSADGSYEGTVDGDPVGDRLLPAISLLVNAANAYMQEGGTDASSVMLIDQGFEEAESHDLQAAN